MRRAGQHHFLRGGDFTEIGLRAREVRFVRVTVPAGAGISRHSDFGKFRLGLDDCFLVVVRVDQHIEITRHVLSALDQHIVQVRIHPDIRIGHGLAPLLFLVRRQGAGRATGGVDGREVIHQIAEGMQHAARIFLAEAAELAVGAARVVGEDGLELWRLLARGVKLLGSERADADHADIAVAPGLLRNPLDHVVAVPFARAAVARFEIAARRADHMHIAARYEELRVAGFRVTEPQA